MGKCSSSADVRVTDEKVPMRRFIGLFGLYFSLQYLSVSDATVLQFLAPIFTAVAGALFLKENFSKEQAFASCESHSIVNAPRESERSMLTPEVVFSLLGVVLIARPSFMFESNVDDASVAAQSRSIYETVTPSQRMSAVV